MRGIGSRASGVSCRARGTRRSSSAAGTGASSTTACSAGRAEESIARVFDEINEFEAQQRDYGTLLVKLYFDVSADVQEQRLTRRRESPWRTREADDEFIRADDPAYQRALSSCGPIPTRAGRLGARSMRTTSSRRRLPRWRRSPMPGRRRCRPSRRLSSSLANPDSGSPSLRSFSRPRAGGRCARRRPARRSARGRAARSSRSGPHRRRLHRRRQWSACADCRPRPPARRSRRSEPGRAICCVAGSTTFAAFMIRARCDRRRSISRSRLRP